MKKETAIYPSHRKLLGTTLAAAIMTTLSCLLVIVQPHGKVGLVIGIVGAVFFGGCICILFIVLLKILPKQADSVADSGQSADLRTGKRDIHHDRVAAHCGFQRIPNLRAEIHPDRTPRSRPGDRRGKNRIAKGLMRWQMKYFGSPYAITASTVDIGTAELEKILREYLQASREKSAAN